MIRREDAVVSPFVVEPQPTPCWRIHPNEQGKVNTTLYHQRRTGWLLLAVRLLKHVCTSHFLELTLSLSLSLSLSPLSPSPLLPLSRISISISICRSLSVSLGLSLLSLPVPPRAANKRKLFEKAQLKRQYAKLLKKEGTTAAAAAAAAAATAGGGGGGGNATGTGTGGEERAGSSSSPPSNRRQRWKGRVEEGRDGDGLEQGERGGEPEAEKQGQHQGKPGKRKRAEHRPDPFKAAKVHRPCFFVGAFLCLPREDSRFFSVGRYSSNLPSEERHLTEACKY